MVPVGALLIIEPLPSSNPAAFQLNTPVLTTCPPLLMVGVPLKVPPLNCTRLVTTLPPLQVMPPAFCTMTGVEPSSVPLENVNVAGFQGPVPLKFTVPPERIQALPLTVVEPANVVVPPLKVQVPLRFKPTGMVMMAPATVKLPAPDIVLVLLIENVPLPKSSVAPDAAVNEPLALPPPVKSSVPPLTATAPELLNTSLMMAVV